MRRILQVALLILTSAALLTPISEAMDRWDPPGLGNDTEMGVFALVLALSLVLLVSKLLALIKRIALVLHSAGPSLNAKDPLFYVATHSRSTSAFEAFSPPLRI